jgi:hypothetical protein
MPGVPIEPGRAQQYMTRSMRQRSRTPYRISGTTDSFPNSSPSTPRRSGYGRRRELSYAGVRGSGFRARLLAPTAAAPAAGLPPGWAVTNFFRKFLYKKPELWHSDLSLDEKAPHNADGKRPPQPRMARTEGKRLKRQNREITAGMKGWRPSAAQRARNRFGLFRRAQFLPHIGSIVCLIPGSGSSPGAGSLRRRPRTTRPLSRPNGAKAPRKTAPALRFASRWEEPEDIKRDREPPTS